MPPRILLFCTNFYRDIGILYVLSRIAEAIGCKCFIACPETVGSDHVRKWDPQAVFFMTAGRLQPLSKLFPKAKLFYCAAEGGEEYIHCDELKIIRDKPNYDRLERIYVWGNNSLDHFRRCIADDNLSHIDESHWTPGGKIRLNGTPKSDLIRFMPRPPRKSGSRKINMGLVGAYSFINNKRGDHPLVRLFDYPCRVENVKGLLNILQAQATLLKELPAESYNFSLRPYPMENRKVYAKVKHVAEGKLTIDNSLDFATWCLQQDIIVGVLSSTALTIHLSGASYLNLTDLCFPGNPAYSTQYFQEFDSLYRDATPLSLDRLLELAQAPPAKVEPGKRLKDYLNFIYNLETPGSAIRRIAEDMAETVRAQSQVTPPGFPLPLLRVLSECHLTHLRGDSYTYFSHFFNRKRLHAEYNQVVENILNDRPQR
ncbi:hypothetical protein NNJEOMEG_02696 [Fundidesulfovibrio magnetotacticus]|uniref:Surface carbohydrate biosynthesis protein n=1 Tax=Fundidesulfovibrio magnetotacticus TaxID=2730080 RepID=A0A6V8LX59_9BACT|nr:hypothetical protein [Fundidesulfovibrio magnetotacticus]GFK94848.1 hypothetical protein NNJEOMEG_02696 [Fundidesulfovibrio magnetotacticus]